MQITVADISVDIIRKNIKNIYLSVLPPDGRVRVSAPKRISDDFIIAFVQAKLAWIKTRQERILNHPRTKEREFVSGETLYVWGIPYTLQVEVGSKYSLVLDGRNAVFTVRKGSNVSQRQRFINEWYRSLLKAEVANYLPKWEEITGLYSSGWQSKDMKTKWGTCNIVTRKIWLNLQLAQKPIDCLEYVILHELAHLKVKNHGADFVAILNFYMPDWRARKKLLNDRV